MDRHARLLGSVHRLCELDGPVTSEMSILLFDRSFLLIGSQAGTTTVPLSCNAQSILRSAVGLAVLIALRDATMLPFKRATLPVDVQYRDIFSAG
jgi:hypothetical protein